MAFEKIITINEFFVRMTDDGKAIQGVHAADMERILEDGVVVSSKMLAPRAVNANDTAALGPIAQAFNTAALATVDAHATQITSLTAEKQAALTAQAAAEGERDAARTQVLQLQAQIDAFKAPTVNGVPKEIHKWQLLVGLRKDAMYEPAMAFIATLPPAAHDIWVESSMVERDSPLIVIAQPALKLTTAQVDDMFIRYGKLTQADALTA